MRSRQRLLELNQLSGQSWEQAIKIAPVNLSFNRAPEVDALLTAARANNFEMRMRQAELEQQGFKVELAKKDAYPSFTVGPYFSQERARDRENQFGIGISMPLPLWNRNEGNIETAMARQKQAETSMYVTQRNIERQVVEKALTVSGETNRDGEVATGIRGGISQSRGSWPTVTTGSARCRSQLTSSCRSNISKRSRRCWKPGARRSKRRNNWNCSPGLAINAVQTQSPKP